MEQGIYFKAFLHWLDCGYVYFGMFGAITITCLPLWQSRRQIRDFFAAVFGGLSDRGQAKIIQTSTVAVQRKT